MHVPDTIDPFHDHDSIALLTAFVLAEDARDVDIVSELRRLSKQFSATSCVVGLVLKGRLEPHLRRNVFGPGPSVSLGA